VFFRAKTLGLALAYFRSMFGVSRPTPASDTVAGALYTPYHAAMFVLSIFVVWGLPNTWAFTERLSWPRAVSGLALLAAAVLLMWTQTTNPFLYFQF
jgi:hypothetical protein